MADANFQNFDARMRRIMRHHEALSRGYVTTVTKDGLIVARPTRRVARWLPVRPLLVLLVAAFAFKVMLYSFLGPEDYAAQVAGLAVGTPLEQVATYILHADQATVWLAEQIAVLRN